MRIVMSSKFVLAAVALGLVSVVLGGCAGSADDNVDSSAGAASLGPATASRNSPLCRGTEQVMFSCRTTNNKLIAICASADLSTTSGYVQYRFGTDNHVELKLPADEAVQNFRDVTSYYAPENWGASVFQSDITFNSPDGIYAYQVYSSYYHGDVTSGVNVTKSGNPLVTINCSGAYDNFVSTELAQKGGIMSRDF
jgi:hypothetical protein